ncbi:MAG TPA: YiiX/YebB-like N1pC/P60 family cysteine hydrolase [Chitinophagaceae bacterium]|nr:YiiX/YebB-like N1pC/P60 family cysteine hydrolase [Chitinophagaceae bacterium]
MKKTLFILLLAFFACACTNSGDNLTKANPKILPDSVLSERWKTIRVIKDSLREGDLVLRCGNDFVSESFSDFSKTEKLYSHSGIALMNEGVMVVYSNMAGDINPGEIIRRDEVDSFITPANNVAVGLYRYDITNEELERLKRIVLAYYDDKLQFDMNFDLSTDDKMYCAEMIAKAIEQATKQRIRFSKSTITPAMKEKYLKKLLDKKVIPSAKVADQREYLALDNLYLHTNCREVKKILFGKPQLPTQFPAPENYEH